MAKMRLLRIQVYDFCRSFRIFVEINQNTFKDETMKTRAALFLTILAVLSLQSCGVISLPADQSQRVQTTFFGASFGDKGEYDVKDKMSENGIGYRWLFVEKGTWGIENVSFAGKDWSNTLVRFTEKRLSSISFANTFSNKQDATKRLDEMRELLGKKYTLQLLTEPNSSRQIYYYKDYLGNTVFLAVSKLKVSGPDVWSCSLNYSWYKVPQIAEEKALNDI